MPSYSILIVKTSSLGDIIQSFPILDYIHERFPGSQVDWVVEASFAPLVSAHPGVHRTLIVDLQGWKQTWNWKKLAHEIACLREKKYDLVFDLQKNTKSGLITALTRSSMKVGFGLRSVREWPNVLATHRRFEILVQDNVRLQYLGLVQNFLGEKPSRDHSKFGVRFTISEQDRDRIASIFHMPALQTKLRVMVCPGSRWINKKLPVETMGAFLDKIRQVWDVSFLLMWGDQDDLAECKLLQSRFPDKSVVVDKLPIPVWQNCMNEVDLVIAVDSAALHLCGTTKTPSFSVFGPTASPVFKPLGEKHFALQGPCPYGKAFLKQCPILRTCKTGACIRKLNAEAIFRAFSAWWNALLQKIEVDM